MNYSGHAWTKATFLIEWASNPWPGWWAETMFSGTWSKSSNRPWTPGELSPRGGTPQFSPAKSLHSLHLSMAENHDPSPDYALPGQALHASAYRLSIRPKGTEVSAPVSLHSATSSHTSKEYP